MKKQIIKFLKFTILYLFLINSLQFSAQEITAKYCTIESYVNVVEVLNKIDNVIPDKRTKLINREKVLQQIKNLKKVLKYPKLKNCDLKFQNLFKKLDSAFQSLSPYFIILIDVYEVNYELFINNELLSEQEIERNIENLNQKEIEMKSHRDKGELFLTIIKK